MRGAAPQTPRDIWGQKIAKARQSHFSVWKYPGGLGVEPPFPEEEAQARRRDERLRRQAAIASLTASAGSERLRACSRSAITIRRPYALCDPDADPPQRRGVPWLFHHPVRLAAWQFLHVLGHGARAHPSGRGLRDPDQPHVPARRLDAPYWQHAVSVDLRRQPRRRNGPSALPPLLPCCRTCRRWPAIRCRTRLARADGRRVRRHCGRHGRLSSDVSQGPRRCAGDLHHLLPGLCLARLDRAGAVVRAAGVFRPVHPHHGRRRCLLGPCGGLWRRADPDPAGLATPGGTGYWSRTEGHPPHPEASYPMQKTGIPRVPRR